MTGSPRSLGVILAGGAARRMDGVDKGAVSLAGKRLFDHVYERLAAQVDRVLVAGPHDYDAGLTAVEDRPDGPAGPAAGLYAALAWLEKNATDARGFVTAPVDAPFLPRDLADRLHGEGGSAVARCAGRRHPTFAYWDAGDLSAYLRARNRGEAPALHDIAASLNARDVDFDDETAFFNVNAPADIKAAEALIVGGG